LSAALVSTTLQTSTRPIPNSALSKIDVYVNYAVAGAIKVWVGGVLVIDYSGDMTTDGATSLTGFQLGVSWGASFPSGSNTCWSEMILADEDTRSLGLATIVPLAAGNTQSWTGAVTDINEATLSDATIITTPTAAQIAQFTVTNPASITGSSPIRALVVNARAAKGATGPQNIEACVRTASTDYTSGNLPGLSTTLDKVGYVFATNPNSGAPWLMSALTTTGFNVGVKSAT
jgi:hypothetical protein